MRTASRVSLFLDFDGTLVPIAADPATPRLDPATAETLKMLSSQVLVITTIISGRAVEDLYSRIRLEGLIYSGNHGLEIFGRNLCFVEPVAWSLRTQLGQLCDDLAARLQAFAGVIIEHKGLTASIHYRQAAKADFEEIQCAVQVSVASTGGLFHVTSGRKVFEVVPHTSWHKGTAARWINSQLGEEDVLSIYLGDDTTDENAFRMLPDAITIQVGNMPITSARFQLPDPAAVHEFLLWLAIQEASRPVRSVEES